MSLRIGVFGDSFAARTPYNPKSPFKKDESWMQILENVGHKVTTYGKTGTSTWYSYEKFLSHHEQFDHIIFCYSSLNRIHWLPEGMEDLSFLSTPDELYETRRDKGLTQQQEREMVRILTGHVPGLSETLNLFIKQKIFDDVNLLCLSKNIKITNLLTFDDRNQKKYNLNLDSRQGDVLYNLISVSLKELPTMGRVDNRWCHLSQENNDILATLLFESMISDKRNIIDLFKHPLWSYSKEITDRYSKDLDRIVT